MGKMELVGGCEVGCGWLLGAARSIGVVRSLRIPEENRSRARERARRTFFPGLGVVDEVVGGL